jgi:hypothetical protein
MAEQWYYQAFGQDFGPLSLDELARMLHEGELADDDLVREGNRGAWSAAAGAKVLTERATTLALETAEVATDIDSFMLMDEKQDSNSEIVAFEASDAPQPVPAPAVENRGTWYFQSLGQEFGPVPFSELLEMAGRGEVSPDDSVRKGESGQWVPAGLIDGLFADDAKDQNADDDDVFVVSNDVQPVVPANRRQSQAPPPTRGAPGMRPSSAPVPFQAAAYQQFASAAVQAPVDTSWYCYLNDQEIGPVGITDLQGYASTGQITPDVYVKYGADGEWVQASQIPQIYAQPSVVAPIPLPPAYQPAPAAAPQVSAAAAMPAAAQSPASTLADAERMELAHQLLALLKREISPADLGVSVGAPAAGGWYCNISGSIMGPVTIDALVQMVLQKRIFAEDLIRLGTQGEWFPAKSVPELFPSESGGKKKGGVEEGESVLSKIDKMYRDAQEAKEKKDAANKAAGISEEAAKPAPKSAPAVPQGDVFRNLNSSIARAATMSTEDRKKMGSSSSSSGGETMGEQLDDLLGKVGLRGKGLYVVIGIAMIGIGAYFTPYLMTGLAASSAYDAMLVIQAQIMKAHDSEAGATAWTAQAKDVRKKLKELMARVKGGTGASPLRDISKMGLYLQEMAEQATIKVPAGTPPEEDPYLIALSRFKDTQSRAKKKLGKKK